MFVHNALLKPSYKHYPAQKKRNGPRLQAIPQTIKRLNGFLKGELKRPDDPMMKIWLFFRCAAQENQVFFPAPRYGYIIFRLIHMKER